MARPSRSDSSATERPFVRRPRSALPDSFRAPSAHWVPTELGERVLDYLRAAPAPNGG